MRVLLEQRVVDRQDRAAGIAEYDLDALIDQGLDHHRRSEHLQIAGHRKNPFSGIVRREHTAVAARQPGRGTATLGAHPDRVNKNWRILFAISGDKLLRYCCSTT